MMELSRFINLNEDVVREAVDFWSLKEFVGFESACKSRDVYMLVFGKLELIIRQPSLAMENASNFNGKFWLDMLRWLNDHPNIACEIFHFGMTLAPLPYPLTPVVKNKLKALNGQCMAVDGCFDVLSDPCFHNLPNLTSLRIYNDPIADSMNIVLTGSKNLHAINISMFTLNSKTVDCLIGLHHLRVLALDIVSSTDNVSLFTFHPILQRLEEFTFKIQYGDRYEVFCPDILDEENTLSICPNLTKLTVDLLITRHLLKICPNITHLTLYDLTEILWFDEEESLRIVDEGANFAKKLNLKSLQFKNTPLEFVDLFLHHSQTIETLDIALNDPSAASMNWRVICCEMPNLTAFRCSRVVLDGDFLKQLATNCGRLTHLAVQAPSNGYESFKKGIQFLFKHLRLRHLEYDYLTHEVNVHPLLNLATLEKLSLGNINIDAGTLREIIENNQRLKYVSITFWNEECIHALMEVISNNAINLQELEIQTTGKYKVVESACENVCNYLKLMPKLRRLYVRSLAIPRLIDEETTCATFAEIRRKDPVLQKIEFRYEQRIESIIDG